MWFFKSSPKEKQSEVENLQFSKTEKTDKLEKYNTKAISLFECKDNYILSGDKNLTNIHTHLSIDKNTGKITESNEKISSQYTNPSFYSGFLGIINIMGVNFLMLVPEVHVLFILDGKDKVFEIASLEFKQISQVQNKQSKEIEEFISYIQKYLCKSGGYYFSYTYPLTLSQQKINDLRRQNQNQQKSIFHLVDNDYLWNHHLMKPLVDQKINKEWQAQLIQGHIYNVVICKELKNQQMNYTLISRRQCKRGGTRYSHRGVDSDGYVANFVESEQILHVISMKRIISHVQIRGSVPSYWTQRGLSAKLNLESSRQLSDQASSLHFDYLKNQYTNVICANLMTDHKSDESKLMNEFKTLIMNPPTQDQKQGPLKQQYQNYVQYLEFDFHQEVKGGKFENIDKFITDNFLSDIQNFGFFVKKYYAEQEGSQKYKSINDQEGEIQWRQKGVLRTNCLDCLDRTNFFQLRFAYLVINQVIFPYLGIQLKNESDTEMFQKEFKYSWGKNGDRISRHYAGTKATTSLQAKKGKSGVLGFIKGKLTSGQRFFKGTFTDAYKQQCYSMLLGEHYESQSNLLYQEDLLKQLKLAEPQYTQYNSITIFAVSWSVNSYVPQKKTPLTAIFNNNYHSTNDNYKLAKRENSFMSSNSNSSKSDSLKLSENIDLVRYSSQNSKKCDLVVVGLQEIAELSAKNFLLSSESKYKELQLIWKEIIHESIGGEKDYFFVDSHNMAGVTTYIFASNILQGRVSNIEYDEVPNNFGGKLLNKGGVGLRFWVDDTSIAVLNCHLPAGQSHVDQRVSSLNYIHQKLYQSEGMASYKRDPIYKSDKVILMGNLNFRVDKKSSECKNDLKGIINLQKGCEFTKSIEEIQSKIVAYDQLKCLHNLVQSTTSYLSPSLDSQNQIGSQEEIKIKQEQNFIPQSHEAKKYFSNNLNESIQYLQHYYEKKINFLPTYKFDVGTDQYDSSWKDRVPSYSDRILIWDIESQNQNIEKSFLQYNSVSGINDSDHKPIYAVLSFGTKEISYEIRDQIADEILYKQKRNSLDSINNNINEDEVDEQRENVEVSYSLVDKSF